MTPPVPADPDGTDAPKRLLDLAVSDIRQHVYCPRIPFFRLGARLPHRYVTGAMQEGILEHQRTEALEQRRTFRASARQDRARALDARLRAERLPLAGRLDMIDCHASEVMPVQFKNPRAGV